MGVKSFTDMKKGLEGCDIVMMLRLQNERMQGSFLPSKREYYEFYGLTPEKLKFAKKDALIAAEPMRLLREERNIRIAMSDWMANSDVTMSDEWKTYRQALRDITSSATSLDDVTWPTEPS